jgi:hypothetical protein
MTKDKEKRIKNYLIRPPLTQDKSRYDFNEDKLKKMLIDLSKDSKYKLLGEVDTVCIQWSSLRIAPNNDIGVVARYQECKQILENLLKL